MHKLAGSLVLSVGEKEVIFLYFVVVIYTYEKSGFKSHFGII